MLGVTSMVAAAALLIIPVERARATVTGPGTGAAMTGTGAAGETWCAAQTTASSSASTTIPRTTAARDPAARRGTKVSPQCRGPCTSPHTPLSGAPGAPGHHAAAVTSR